MILTSSVTIDFANSATVMDVKDTRRLLQEALQKVFEDVHLRHVYVSLRINHDVKFYGPDRTTISPD